MPIRSRFGHFITPVEAKTANYTLSPSDFGKIFTNRGASAAVTFTLPDPAPQYAGAWVRFMVEADQNVTIRAVSASKLVVFNNAAATSIAFSTAGERIGGGCLAVCNDNGTKWLIFVNLGTETQTPTIA